jgi:predicted anti-sigma-YlaC factor YlaD
MSLLGPSGPEIGCEECFERLDEFVEGREVPGMAAHLEGCPACREDYESLAALVRDDRDGPQTEHD